MNLSDVKVDREGEIPIGVQLAWALRARIGDGRLAPGQRLPGLRELAEMVGINANTARAVYQRLEQEGLIDSRQGTGTFVAQIAQEPSAVGQIAADAAQQARRTGVDPREVAAALYVTAGTPPAATAATAGRGAGSANGDAAERRRELRAQIAALEQTLSEMQAHHPGLIPTPTKARRHAGPRLLGVEELERIRGELVRRLAAAGSLESEMARAEQPLAGAGDARASARAGGTRARGAPSKVDATTEESERENERAGGQAAVRKAGRARPRTRPSTA